MIICSFGNTIIPEWQLETIRGLFDGPDFMIVRVWGSPQILSYVQASFLREKIVAWLESIGKKDQLNERTSLHNSCPWQITTIKKRGGEKMLNIRIMTCCLPLSVNYVVCLAQVLEDWIDENMGN